MCVGENEEDNVKKWVRREGSGSEFAAVNSRSWGVPVWNMGFRVWVVFCGAWPLHGGGGGGVGIIFRLWRIENFQEGKYIEGWVMVLIPSSIY